MTPVAEFSVNLLPWRQQRLRQIYQRLAIRVLLTGGLLCAVMLLILLPVRLSEQYLAAVTAAEAALEVHRQPQRAILTQRVTDQHLAAEDNARQAQARTANREYLTLLQFLRQQLPEDAWLLRYRAVRQRTGPESRLRHMLVVSRTQVIPSAHPLLDQAPPGLPRLRITGLALHRATSPQAEPQRRFTLMTATAAPGTEDMP